jgi:hypothetical protein
MSRRDRSFKEEFSIMMRISIPGGERLMRMMVLVKAKAGIMPSSELLEAMDKYNVGPG